MTATRLVLGLLHDLTGPDPQDRAKAAEEVSGVVRQLSAEAVVVLSATLVMARLAETSGAAQEAELQALVALDAEHHPLTSQVLHRLWEVDPATVTGAQSQYMVELLAGEK